jgi:hypothetical protein
MVLSLEEAIIMARTAEQNIKFNLLKSALEGDGPALDTMFIIGVPPVYGTDYLFHGGGPYPAITTEDTWETIDETIFSVAGGRYSVEFLVFFTGAETNRAYQCRVLVNGTPTGEIINVQLSDAGNQVEYSSFNDYTLVQAPYTVTLQALIPAAGGTPSMTVTRWRMRFVKVSD